MTRPTISDDELARGWNSLADRDISILVRSTRRKLYQMRLVLGAEISLAVAAYVFVAWTLVRDLPMPWVIYTAFFALAGSVMLARSIRLRRGTWHARGTQTGELLELALQRARAGAALARLHLWGLAVAWVFVVIWTVATWSTTAVNSAHSLSTWLLVYGLVAGASLISGGFAVHYLRRKHIEIRHLEIELQIPRGDA